MTQLQTFTFVLLTVSTFCISKALTAEPPLTIPAKEQIADRVKRLTGLEDLFPISQTDAVPLSDLHIPFLSPSLRNQQGLKVSFRPGRLRLPTFAPGVTDLYERNFSVFFDKTGNQLISVTARLGKEVPAPPQEPSPETEET